MEKYLINPNQRISKIRKDIYGHFIEHLGRCIYDGLYVGKDSPIPNWNGIRLDVLNALKEIRIPVLRWPGGCFADDYHWQDGIGPVESRKRTVNSYWGGIEESNAFGTHEFLDLCEYLGCDAYVNGNVGSGTVREMMDWIEYITYDGSSAMADLRRQNGREKPWKLSYFGIGNENWGCGGNMSAEYYADEFSRYSTFVRNLHPDSHIYKICGGANGSNNSWAEGILKNKKAVKNMHGLSMHHYNIPGTWENKGKALVFSDAEYYTTIQKACKIEAYIRKHSNLLDQYDPTKKVGLIIDEWGNWLDVEDGTNPNFLFQQNTMRDAIVTGLTLNIFNKHSNRIHMANLAQMINVVHSILLTDGEDLALTPTYYIFKLFADHQDNTLLGSYITTPQISEADNAPQLQESASIDPDGTITATIVNTSLDTPSQIHCQIADFRVKNITAQIVSGTARDYNQLGEAPKVFCRDFSGFTATEDGFLATLPPCSVVKLTIS